MDSPHHCPSERTAIPYYTCFVHFEARSVLVKLQNSVIYFPIIESPEVPHRGKCMSDCFSVKLEQLCGTKYELVFLNSTINYSYRRHLPGPHFAIFEYVGPFDDELRQLMPPARSEYRWMTLPETYGHEKSPPDAYAWQRALWSFKGDEDERDIRPWEVPGWLAFIKPDVIEALQDMQYHVTGPFEQYQVSSTAAVLRIPTDKGRVYFKTSHEREGSTMKCISKFAPFFVPSPLYVEKVFEFMLMKDYGPTLAGRLTRADYDNVLVLHGRLQLASLDHIEELIEIGVQRTEFETFKAKAKELLEDSGVEKSLREISGVADMRPYYESLYVLLRKLYVDLNLPMTIVHGDMHDENIIKTERKGMEYVLYDWGEARIDIPFTDVMALKYAVRDEDDSVLGIESYLQIWAQYGSVEFLKKVCSALHMKALMLNFIELHDLAKYRYVKEILLEEDIKMLWEHLSLIHHKPPL